MLWSAGSLAIVIATDMTSLSVEAMLRGHHVMECWVLGNSNSHRYD